jgi:PAS domain S-box-containing protein
MPAEGRGSASDVAALDDLLEYAPCGFLSFADDGTVELVNATLLGILGHERADVLGRRVEHIMTTGTRIFYQTHFFPLLRLHGHAEEIFMMLRTAGGADVGMLVNAVRRERLGRSAYDCVLMRVNERQKYEQELLLARRAAEGANEELRAQQQLLEDQAAELESAGEELRSINDELLERTEELEEARAIAEEANHAKSSFLAVMSHELRTPLNAIAGYVQILEMGIYGPVSDQQREALDRITRSQRHLLRLINDILNLARIEAGRVDYEIIDVGVDVIVGEVTPLVEPQLNTQNLTLTTMVPQDLMVHVDRDKVQQILLNLLSNAVKFTTPGGRVSVTAGVRDARFVEVAVSDTGIGIPASKLESVFEPFVQVDVQHSTRKEGTGLGLAISRDLARGMDGDVEVRSEVGAGSTFTLLLPRATPSGSE